MRELWRNIGFTSGARVYGVLAGAVTMLITTRVLGPEGRGIVATAITWGAFFGTLGHLSLGQVAFQRAGTKEPAEWLGPALGGLMAMTVAVTVAGWVIAAATYLASDSDAFGDIPGYALALGMASLPLVVWQEYRGPVLMAVGRLSTYNRSEVIGRTVGIALVAGLVGAAGAGVAGALIAILASQTVIALAGLRDLVSLAGEGLALDRGTLRNLLRGGMQLHLNAIGSFLFANAAILIVQAVSGSEETGYLQLAIQLMVLALLVPKAASMVLYGEVARLGPDGAWPSTRRVLATLSVGSAAIAAVGFVTAPFLLPLLFGDDFEGAVPVFQILAFGLVGQTFSAVMAPQWIGRGLFWQASLTTLVLGLANVIACFVLADARGAEGGAIALLGVYVVNVLGNGAFAIWISRRPATRVVGVQAS